MVTEGLEGKGGYEGGVHHHGAGHAAPDKGGSGTEAAQGVRAPDLRLGYLPEVGIGGVCWFGGFGIGGSEGASCDLFSTSRVLFLVRELGESD